MSHIRKDSISEGNSLIRTPGIPLVPSSLTASRTHPPRSEHSPSLAVVADRSEPPPSQQPARLPSLFPYQPESSPAPPLLHSLPMLLPTLDNRPLHVYRLPSRRCQMAFVLFGTLPYHDRGRPCGRVDHLRRHRGHKSTIHLYRICRECLPQVGRRGQNIF